MADATTGSRIPDDIKSCLTDEQTKRLDALLSARPTMHALAYRASTSVFGRPFYLAVLAGAEARSHRRLRGEGLKRRMTAVVFEVALFCLAVSAMLCVLTGMAIIVLYVMKIAVGIDLFDGPSPLHPIFEFLYGR